MPRNGFILLLILLSFSLPAWAGAGSDGPKITAVSGEVQVLPGGDEAKAKAASVGMALKPKDVVRTGAKSSAKIDMGENKEIELAGNAILTIGPPPSSLSAWQLTRQILFSTIGGLGLLIFGVRLLGDGLQKAAGDKLRRILGAFTSNPVKGVLVGAGSTAIVQSSSATTVMLVGFVNAGLMTLQQALGVVFGANIGTTVTVKLAAFKLEQYALPAIGVGLALHLFGRRKLIKNLGMGLLGFGLLFLGICVLKDGVDVIKQSPRLVDILQWGAAHPVFGLVIAMLITDLVQSSSATTVMVLTLATGGLLGDPNNPREVLPKVLPLILGCNIGTCITALLASIGTNTGAKRVAIAHVIFNVTGAAWVMIVMPIFVRLVLLTSSDLGQLVANSHIMFNVANTAVFLLFTNYYARFLMALLPEGEDKQRKVQYLDDRLLNAPSMAIEASERELVNMAEIARSMMQRAMGGFFEKDRKALDEAAEEEDVVDDMQREVTEYVVRLSEQELSPDQSRKVPALIHAVNDIERIGDHAENLVELAQAKLDDKVKFSKKARAEIRELYGFVDSMFDETIQALRENDAERAANVVRLENSVNELDKVLRDHHVDRLKSKKCKVPAGVIFLDLLTNFEKIGDHLTNIAEAVEDALQWEARKAKEKQDAEEPEAPEEIEAKEDETTSPE
ncbi:MAG: Na/Pi cotransporter family protein [Planctomycetes bacterium]|nr:Na/Pi cotransporter family protein [Planctomycetota bacterium]